MYKCTDDCVSKISINKNLKEINIRRSRNKNPVCCQSYFVALFLMFTEYETQMNL